ncbi:MAG: hypothetical protein LAT62_16065, partial [Natronospirillum sp.]|uniref:hypothetical protein n=1 Tax=Natronospirillum sp. TaxID=2812955 RepID=UPI0025D8B9CB
MSTADTIDRKKFNWTARGRVVEDIDRDQEQLDTFAEAFGEAVGQAVYPASLRVKTVDIMKFKPKWVVRVGIQERLVVPALLYQQPVWITLRHPMRPPLTQRLHLFASTNLFAEQELEEGSPVRLHIDRTYMGRAHVIDWARSLGTVLD